MSGRIMPVPDELSKPFWEAAKARKLWVQRCPTTGRSQWYPRLHSLYDWSVVPEWMEVSGLGRLHSFSVIYRASTGLELPYILGAVDLDEGVRVTTNIVDVPVADVQIGMRVAVEFEELDGFWLPVFTRAPESSIGRSTVSASPFQS